MKVSHYIRELALVGMSLICLLGMKAFGEENKRHVVDGLLKDFQKDVEAFEKGLEGQTGSGPAMQLRRSLLLLSRAGVDEKAEVAALKEFPKVDEALRAFIKGEKSLEEMAKK